MPLDRSENITKILIETWKKSSAFSGFFGENWKLSKIRMVIFRA